MLAFEGWDKKECWDTANRLPVPDELHLYDYDARLSVRFPRSRKGRRDYILRKVLAILESIKADPAYLRKIDHIRRGDIQCEVKELGLAKEIRDHDLEAEYELLVAYDQWFLVKNE